MPRDYSHLTKEQLIALLQSRDERRLGLVWERDPALIGTESATHDDFVALEPDHELHHGDGPYPHLVIEGDNLDALRYLRMTHAGRVDCIYIDPPYNTGNRDFVYNDRFVNPDDQWRHSRWIEFMWQRLTLARDLLAEHGIIFVSIDDHEVFHLGLLMNQVFGEQNFVANCIWQKRTSPDARLRLGGAHDYILAYSLNNDEIALNKLKRSGEQSKNFKNPDNDERGPWSSSDFTAQGYRPNQMYEIITPSGRVIKPPPGRCWGNIEPAYRKLLAENRIWFGNDGGSRPRVKNFLSETEGVSAWTWWPHEEVGHNQEAKKEILELLGGEDSSVIFSTPKPVRLIERILRIATKPDSLVLDFFAGSGTTAHAVLKLNAEDGGNRRCILVSSTEATVDDPTKNLCRDVCAERVRRVAGGYTPASGEPAPGLGGQFAYLRVHRLPRHKLAWKLAHSQVWTALQLTHFDDLDARTPEGPLWIREDEVGVKRVRICYVAKHVAGIELQLTNLTANTAEAVVYAWQPELLRQHASHPRLSIRPVPQTLMDRFAPTPRATRNHAQPTATP